MKILLIEDDIEISEMLCSYLIAENFEVVCATDGQKACETFDIGSYSIVLLDLMIPKITGMNVMKYIRQKSTVPIIIISAKDSDSDKTLGLGLGADDYITKPFNSREVVARIKAVLRRAGAQEKQEGRSRVEYDGLTIDMEEYQVVAFGQKMTFTAKEMELLWCLATNPGKAFSRNQLLETIWGYSYYGDTRTVDTHIKRIRQKLNIPENSKWDITTIWGVGYKFEVKSE